jgi:superfamily I DNA/RNA helicase/RecB family exonuclease
VRSDEERPRVFRLVRRAVASPTPARVWDEPATRALAHTTGPLLVRGGPGTGKTSLLVDAVTARVAEGTDPARILVLTFGRRDATALRNRIEAALAEAAPAEDGGHVTAEPLVRTFQAYAFGLLRRAAADIGDPSPRLLTGPEQDLIIRELLATGDPGRWPAGLAAALPTREFASQLRDLLLRAAERGIGAAELAAIGRRHGRPDWPAAAAFLAEYDEVLALRDVTGRAGAGYDAAEIVRAAAVLLAEDPALLTAERSRVEFVYVDEFADADPAQIDLLALVAGDGQHLVAFADADSSTFAFRGADPSDVAEFPSRFRTLSGSDAPTVTLSRTYRTAGPLLVATRRVASRLRGPSRHRDLIAGPDQPPGDVAVHTFRSTASEAAYVAHCLREAHLIDGVPWDRMAVLVKSTALRLPGLRRALHQAGVPTVTLAADLPIAAQPAIGPLLLMLSCALQPDRLDEASAVTLLHSPIGGADPLAERRLRQELRALAAAAGDRRHSGELLIEALREPTELAAVRRRWAAPAYAVANALAATREAADRPDSTVEDVLWALWRATGLADRWAAESAKGGPRGAAADRDLDAVVALFETASKFVDRLPGARAEVFLDHLLGQELPGDSIAPTADRGAAVRVLTAHASKGLEWDVVVVAGVQEGIWPDLRLRGSVLGSERLVDIVTGRAGPPATPTEPAAEGASPVANAARETATLLDEERRLFYVASTRARRRLVVTAVHSGDGEEQPSRFLTELVPVDPDVDGEAEMEATRLPRALTLGALVAELRAALGDPLTPPGRKRAAARQLRRLADAGVPGAEPDQWWGLPDLSDSRPLVDDDEQVVVTPSTVEVVQRCSLRWLLERHGGGDSPSPEQSVGNLVHEVAMSARDAETVDRAALVEYVVGRFGEIELSARWLADRERGRAEAMIDKLINWLGTNPRRLSAIEREFLVQLDQTVQIKGRVDRLETDDQGRLVVVDLKTGKTTVRADDVAELPQLGAYQAAVEAGAFADVGDVSGGAELVQLGTGVRASVQAQPALSAADDPGWAADLVRETARTMAASTFRAVVNAKCRTCPVRHACPVSGQGRQLTGSDPVPGPPPGAPHPRQTGGSG